MRLGIGETVPGRLLHEERRDRFSRLPLSPARNRVSPGTQPLTAALSPARRGASKEGDMDTTTLLIIILVILLIGGGGYYGRGRWY